MIVDQGLLNKVWFRWTDDTYSASTSELYYSRDYARVSRRSAAAQQFELWLWAEGASIRRENKKCYLEFHTEDDATAFVLRNSWND